jgi:hypothetical protein
VATFGIEIRLCSDVPSEPFVLPGVTDREIRKASRLIHGERRPQGPLDLVCPGRRSTAVPTPCLVLLLTWICVKRGNWFPGRGLDHDLDEGDVLRSQIVNLVELLVDLKK